MVGWGKEDKPAGRQEVFSKTGVYPEQVVDLLALTGDTVDNISGVDGVGPKTAAKLLAKFGTWEGIMKELNLIEPSRIRELLTLHRERVERNRQLVRLNPALDCFPGWESMATRPEKAEAMRPFYARMEFHSLIRGCDQGELF